MGRGARMVRLWRIVQVVIEAEKISMFNRPLYEFEMY